MDAQDMNLVPPEYTERVQRRRDTTIAAAIAIGCCLGVAIASHMLMRSVSLRLREVAVLRERIDLIRTQRMELVALVQEKERILQTLGILANRFRAGRWIEPVRAFALAPETVLLRTLQAADDHSPSSSPHHSPQTRQRITVTGWASSEQDLQHFADILLQSGCFSTVRADQTRQTRFEDIDAVEFQLECLVQASFQENAP